MLNSCCYYYVDAANSATIRTKYNEFERDILGILQQCLPSTSITSIELSNQLRKNLNTDISHGDVKTILEKLAAQDILKYVNNNNYI